MILPKIRTTVNIRTQITFYAIGKIRKTTTLAYPRRNFSLVSMCFCSVAQRTRSVDSLFLFGHSNSYRTRHPHRSGCENAWILFWVGKIVMMFPYSHFTYISRVAIYSLAIVSQVPTINVASDLKLWRQGQVLKAETGLPQAAGCRAQDDLRASRFAAEAATKKFMRSLFCSDLSSSKVAVSQSGQNLERFNCEAEDLKFLASLKDNGMTPSKIFSTVPRNQRSIQFSGAEFYL